MSLEKDTSSMFTELCGSSHLSLTFGSQLNKSQQFVREAISYDFLTVADDRRVRNSGIHVVVDYFIEGRRLDSAVR